MLNFNLNYSHPWLLLLIIPAVLLTLIPYFRSSKKYRRTRNRIISMTLHLVAMVLAINLLAGLVFSYEIRNEENEIILLVDASDSNGGSKDQKDEFIQSVLNICEDDFKVGIVKFGFDQVYAAQLWRIPERSLSSIWLLPIPTPPRPTSRRHSSTQAGSLPSPSRQRSW